MTDGSDETAPLFGSYCGNTDPPSITSSGNSLWVRFRSDASVNSIGFTATYTHIGKHKCCAQLDFFAK